VLGWFILSYFVETSRIWFIFTNTGSAAASECTDNRAIFEGDYFGLVTLDRFLQLPDGYSLLNDVKYMPQLTTADHS